jgi:hypothetical protein
MYGVRVRKRAGNVIAGRQRLTDMSHVPTGGAVSRSHRAKAASTSRRARSAFRKKGAEVTYEERLLALKGNNKELGSGAETGASATHASPDSSWILEPPAHVLAGGAKKELRQRQKELAYAMHGKQPLVPMYTRMHSVVRVKGSVDACGPL